MVKVGIIGWGKHGDKIAKVISNHKSAVLLAVATTLPKVMLHCRDRLGVKYIVNHYKELVKIHEIDLVIICSSSEYHIEHISKSLEFGHHVVIIPPLSSNVQQAKEIQKITSSYPSLLSTIGFSARYHPEVLNAKWVVENGKLGKIISAEVYSTESYKDHENHIGDKGLFMDVMYEDIDLVSYILGSKLSTVYAIGNSIRYPHLIQKTDVDTAMVTGQNIDGSLVYFHSCRVPDKISGYKMAIRGAKGEIKISAFPKVQNIRYINGMTECQKIKVPNPFTYYFDTLIKTLIDEARMKSNIEAGIYTTTVAVGMTKSFVLGNIINID